MVSVSERSCSRMCPSTYQTIVNRPCCPDLVEGFADGPGITNAVYGSVPHRRSVGGARRNVSCAVAQRHWLPSFSACARSAGHW